VASPIALATKLAEADKGSPEDMDFLSSVEIVVASRCDCCQMQNWSHVVSGYSHPTAGLWLNRYSLYAIQGIFPQSKLDEHIIDSEP